MKNIITIYFLVIITAFNAQVIVIDPGHGYDSSGGNPDGRTATEINTALEVGLRLKTLINAQCPSWTAYMTRTTANGWISISQRASMSNSWGGDFYLSIHGNGGGGSGTETFWCVNNDGSSTDDIAFAQAIQNKMVTHGSWINRRCVEDGSYIFHLGVLSQSNATGCLNEIGFVDNTTVDAPKLLNTAWRDSFALAYKKALENIIGSCSGGGGGTITPTATNDFCGSQIQLQSSTVCSYTAGTLNGASSSFATLVPSCDGFSGTASKKDVFYSFIAAAATHTVKVNSTNTTSNGVDAVLAVYSGTACSSSSLTEIACVDAGSAGGSETAVLTGLTVGQKYLIRVYDYGTVDPTDPNFNICVTHNAITTGVAKVFENAVVSIKPNPSSGLFTIQKVNYTEDIKLNLFNNIGQQIYTGVLFQQETVVSLESQPAGIYILSITTASGDVKTYKLIKE